MTDRHIDVIECLILQRDHWVTPQYLGGRDGSHHASTLRTLARRGWVDVRKICRDHAQGDPRCRCKSSNKYRLTARAVWFTVEECWTS